MISTPAVERFEEARQQRPAALDLVRLDPPLAHEAPKPVASRLEHRHRVAPRIEPFREREVVQAAEQLQRAVPAARRRRSLARPARSEAAADLGIQRRAAALALLRLVEENAARARRSALRARSSPARRSCRTLRGRPRRSRREPCGRARSPPCRQPAMNWLYDSPWPRAAALMRMIHSRRMSRLRALRSR